MRDYEFSYTTETYSHEIDENPFLSSITIPLSAFSHDSTLQVLSRYLVDTKEFSFTDAARLLQRSPKTIWASYHQTKELPPIPTDDLHIPIDIFCKGLAPLEALVLHLKSLGMRNKDIAENLKLSPKTTSTAAKRGEVKQ